MDNVLYYNKRGRFIKPNRRQREAAICVSNASEENKPILACTEGFREIQQPSEGDWLAEHQEGAQNFFEYRQHQCCKPTKRRNTFYIQPVGTFDESCSPPLELLGEFASCYFHGMNVELLEPLKNITAGNRRSGACVYQSSKGKRYNIRSRTNSETNNLQLVTGDIMNALKNEKSKRGNCFCMLAVTMVDVYPNDKWNFVFGEASLSNGVGVFSFARYSPYFGLGVQNPTLSESDMALLIKRSCQVLAHETGHMFGIHHCVYYDCCMNGANHLEESDSQSIFLCPIDLHKLCHAISFDIIERYIDLCKFYQKFPYIFKQEIIWCQKRIGKLKSL